MAEPGGQARLGVLLSGRGSNFLALQDAIEAGDVPARVALVVSNVEDAPGLAAARERHLPVRFIPHRGEPSRQAHEAKVLAALRQAEVEWVCLAGYMRILSPQFLAAYPQRILNIHPSLLPAFPGLDAQQQAYDYGVRVAGCTVHLVDDGVDTGPIVVQRHVTVRDDMTASQLSAEILVQEHQAYAEALRRLLSEPWEVRGRRLVFAAAASVTAS